jgi:hypothetical protein
MKSAIALPSLRVRHVAHVAEPARLELGLEAGGRADRHGALHHQHHPLIQPGQLVQHAVDP